MTLATYEEVVDAEVVLSDSDAEDFDTRFQVALGTYAEARQELIDCVEFVRNTNIAERMGFKSRGDYIAARVAGLNVKWAVEDRRSLVELMAHDESTGRGMSNVQIGRALGVTDMTVNRDLKATSTFVDVDRVVESSDGKTRTYEAKPEAEPETRDNGENRHTDIVNGTRNDLNLIGGNYVRYVNELKRSIPKAELPPRGNEYIAQYLRDALAEITEATEAAINKLEGEQK